MDLEPIAINKHKCNINREAVTLSTTGYPLLSGLTVWELTDHTSNVSGIIPTGQGPLIGPPTMTSIPVSYTHLDVYKRQVRDSQKYNM